MQKISLKLLNMAIVCTYVPKYYGNTGFGIQDFARPSSGYSKTKPVKFF